MTPTKGTLAICVNCKRLAKTCARGLCNTCYDKDVKSRKIRKCRKCGEIRPHNSHGLCYRCAKNAKYHENNEAEREKRRKHYQDNIEKHRARDHARNRTKNRIEWQQKRNQEQYTKNRQARLDYWKKYRAEHPGFITHHIEKYKARKAGLPDDLTQEQWQNILKEYDYRCAYCGASGTLHREHKIPVSRGGGYTASNIVPACPTCNQRKHTMTDVEFRAFLKKFPR